MTPFTLRRLDHVSLNVRDRDRSVAWYRDVVGLEPESQTDRPSDWPVFMGELGNCIALFQAPAGAPPMPAPHENVGLRHVAFMVGAEDLERAQTHLSEHGVVYRFSDHGNAHSIYFDDPDGHVVELTTYEI